MRVKGYKTAAITEKKIRGSRRKNERTIPINTEPCIVWVINEESVLCREPKGYLCFRDDGSFVVRTGRASNINTVIRQPGATLVATLVNGGMKPLQIVLKPVMVNLTEKYVEFTCKSKEYQEVKPEEYINRYKQRKDQALCAQ